MNGGSRCLCYFQVLQDGTARYADCAEQCSVWGNERQAAGECIEPAIAEFEVMRGGAWLAIIPDRLAAGRKKCCGACFSNRKINRSEHGAVHARESLQVNASIEHGNNCGDADLCRMRPACGNDPVGLLGCDAAQSLASLIGSAYGACRTVWGFPGERIRAIIVRTVLSDSQQCEPMNSPN